MRNPWVKKIWRVFQAFVFGYHFMMIFGYFLVGTGVLFFLQNSGVIHLEWGTVWPLLLVGIGVFLVAASLRIHRTLEVMKRKILGE